MTIKTKQNFIVAENLDLNINDIPEFLDFKANVSFIFEPTTKTFQLWKDDITINNNQTKKIFKAKIKEKTLEQIEKYEEAMKISPMNIKEEYQENLDLDLLKLLINKSLIVDTRFNTKQINSILEEKIENIQYLNNFKKKYNDKQFIVIERKDDDHININDFKDKQFNSDYKVNDFFIRDAKEDLTQELETIRDSLNQSYSKDISTVKVYNAHDMFQSKLNLLINEEKAFENINEIRNTPKI